MHYYRVWMKNQEVGGGVRKGDWKWSRLTDVIFPGDLIFHACVTIDLRQLEDTYCICCQWTRQYYGQYWKHPDRLITTISNSRKTESVTVLRVTRVTQKRLIKSRIKIKNQVTGPCKKKIIIRKATFLPQK